jgi:transposase
MEEKRVVLGVRRYSEELKHLICKEHLEKGIGLSDLARKYKLSSHSLIYDWLRRFKYLPHRYRYERNVIEIGIENYTLPVMASIPPSNNESNQDSSEVSRLRKELENAKIQLEGYQRMIEIAEKEYKISIRKKPNTK